MGKSKQKTGVKMDKFKRALKNPVTQKIGIAGVVAGVFVAVLVPQVTEQAKKVVEMVKSQLGGQN